ncbi:alkaline phosphatase family protein [Nocardioides sp.]|uniref:alkaline phosphatase family protein n=1 Tax=Nocardioides sp. TaxID=35761 RepID=UPI002D7E1977|nr:alkaline phosphatase family protein [Nocardioides sp.]HET8960991.1 alkaline phosphatase family protein [Nocardioides sp.]
MNATTPRTSRRTFVTAGAAGLLFSSMVGSPAVAARGRKRAYVLVVDGCRPDEITPPLTPTLAALRDGGLNHPLARSMPVMETIPNHVMMMTGLRPDRTGVPANTIYDRALGETREMDRPRDIRSRTVIGRLNAAGFTTGTVLSKSYLFDIFGTRATHRWEPEPIVPISGHAPDAFTMDATLSMIEEFDPNLVFVNLGDVDRMGHADETGPVDVKALRQAALADTDAQVSRFVDLLKSSGRWKNSVVIVLADHSMDWSNPDQVISLTGPLEEDPFLAGKVQIAQNGGADLLYWTGPRADRDRAVRRMRSIAAATPGVLAAHDRRADWLRLGPEAGEVVVYCRAGWRFTEPDPSGNPIPGNHGHPATKPIPFFVGGGHPVVPRRSASSEMARTVDVAPTVGAFFGLGPPAGGYDGHNRL